MSGPARIPIADRLWAKVERGDGCWLFQGATTPGGYGKIGEGGHDGATVYVHRLAYQLEVGPIPEGMEIDHVCGTTRCVNPDHLEPVTGAENSRRAGARGLVGKYRSGLTHCVNGHEYTEANTAVRRPGVRRCRACAADRDRRYREARA